MLATRLTTNKKGAIAESAIVHAAIRLGIGVLKPLTDGHRYDLIFDFDPRLARVQCKWATFDDGILRIRCYSSRRTRDGLLKRPYSASEIDALAAYCMETDRCYYFPIDWIAGRSTLQLRTDATRNNQAALVNWASEFEFGATLGELTGP